MPCFKAKTWILAISVATAIGLGATPAAFAKSAGETVAADPLQALNDAFRAEYKATRQTILDRISSEEHTSELQSLMRNSYAVFWLKKKSIHYSHAIYEHMR